MLHHIQEWHLKNRNATANIRAQLLFHCMYVPYLKILGALLWLLFHKQAAQESKLA